MTSPIDTLIHEHYSLDALLSLLEREVTAFECGGEPDYDLVADICEYLLDGPGRCHHAHEADLLGRLAAAEPATADVVAALIDQHRKLTTLIRCFDQALADIRHAPEVPRPWFPGIASSIIALCRRHMQLEESLLFPAAWRCLPTDPALEAPVA